MTTYETEAEATIASEIQSAEMLINGDIIDFDGQNCDECAGWDGNDRRCECGNRRVCWSFQQTPDSQWYFYAEAW